MNEFVDSTKWIAPVLKKGLVSEATEFSPVGTGDDGVLFNS